MRRKNPLKDKSVFKTIITIDKTILKDRNNIIFDVNEIKNNNEIKSEEETI